MKIIVTTHYASGETVEEQIETDNFQMPVISEAPELLHESEPVDDASEPS